MRSRILSFKALAILMLTVAILILGGINLRQQRSWVALTDGARWNQTPEGRDETVLVARVVANDSPAGRAGIEAGDTLLRVNGRAVRSDAELAQILHDAGEWAPARYAVERAGSVYDFTVIVAPQTPSAVRPYLETIGLLYFLVGAFVLISRSRAPQALHFYLVCLNAFALCVFHFTGKFNAFDWTIYWIDLGALVLLGPLFLHFCLSFPFGKPGTGPRNIRMGLLYVPGAILMTAWLAFVYGLLGAPAPGAFRQLLDQLTDIHFAFYLVACAAVLLRTYRKIHIPDLRQQMKWVTRGTVLAVLPYGLFQALPSIAGMSPGALANLSVLPLALIPISFGYAMRRYRLMDVDILFKRGVIYTLATVSVIGLYAAVAVLVGEGLGSIRGFGPANTVSRIAATILAAVLFAPIKERFQIWLDRFFYRERYDVRQTLIDFGRTLGSEVRLEHMQETIADRLGRALLVDRTALFMEDAGGSERFYPALTTGVFIPPSTNLEFLNQSTVRPYIFSEAEICGLNYFIPCRVKDRVIAYIGLGRTKYGDNLTSEDLELLETVADYIGIALENARLYRSLEQKAAEYQNLKDFSENIIESISVGVVVEDPQGRIAGWNKALEDLTGQRRAEMLGKRTIDAIPAPFVPRLADHRYLYKQRWNNLTVNVSTTSLVDKSGLTLGRLIIIDDITDRIRLEDQLVQNEKLTSIGLLAAGVAHEVNTPLAVISSYSQMLRKEMSPEDSRFKLLEKITKQTFRASEIVNNLLSFSRTTSAEFVEVDIHQVVGDTMALLDHQLKRAGIRIQREFSADSPLVFGNAGRLQQVFLNLFLNARDAMSNGGELRIVTHTADSKIEIVVSDTGTGISGEHISKIYDPFFTTKIAGKGTGLGLSVSYGIVQEHGGNISVESRAAGADGGTAFKLEFPLARKPANV